MAASSRRSGRRWAWVLGLAGVAAMLGACDQVLALGDYQRVACSEYCDSGAMDAFTQDVTIDVFDAGAPDTGLDADAGADAADALPEVQPPGDASFEASPVTLWARWPMPNPDAATAPDSGKLLPNQMSYDAGADGGSPTVYDVVTQLTWWRRPVAVAPGAFNPGTACAPPAVPSSGFQVATRIQLASLIDFTQVPTIDQATFPGVVTAPFWTASATNITGAKSQYWTIDFTTGLTSFNEQGSYVMCVEGP